MGDKVKWKINGFHTVTFPAKGKKSPPFISPDPGGTKIAGVNDAAGNPFRFNGQTRLVLDALGGLPVKGKGYNGSKLVSSGAPLSNGPAKRYTLKFTKKGSYGASVGPVRHIGPPGSGRHRHPMPAQPMPHMHH